MKIYVVINMLLNFLYCIFHSFEAGYADTISSFKCGIIYEKYCIIGLTEHLPKIILSKVVIFLLN